MFQYKLAILWADGVYEGFIAMGADEDDARCQALRSVFEQSARRGIGFKIIPPADVPYLPLKDREKLNEQWEAAIGFMGRHWP